MTISGVADQSYNGSFVVTSTASNTMTYAQAGANSTSSGGTVTKLTGGYVLYPMAEVLGVFDAATQRIDGQLTLAPNTVAWAANDAVEEPHYYQQQVAADSALVGQITPRPTVSQTAGLQYQENVGPGITGWTISNTTAAANYFGGGGTHSLPFAAYAAQGAWQRTMDLEAGQQSVFSVHCNSRGCGRWNSGYDLFELDGNATVDTVNYQPTTSTLQMNMRGVGYQFSPQGFTAGTINAGTVNATTINGAVSAAQLPVFGISGSGHARGVVPDPGATAGTTRYLREDGTWSVPSGTGGSGGQSVGTGLSGGTAPIPGATADYNFLQGLGTSLTDITGNGNSGTLGMGALAPTWTTTGLSFNGTQNVSLPATLNGSQTFFFGLFINPLTSGTLTPPSFGTLLTSSGGGTGFNALYSGLNNHANNPTIFANSSFVSNSITGMTGFHVVAFTLGTSGTSVDHFYIDGVETTYGSQGSSAGSQTSGNLFVGSSNVGPWAGASLNGTFYRLVAFPSQLSASQVAADSQIIRSEVASRGVQVAPLSVISSTPQINAIGDSITFGTGASTPWPSLLNLTNQPSFRTTNWGIPGIQLQRSLTRSLTEWRHSVKPQAVLP